MQITVSLGTLRVGFTILWLDRSVCGTHDSDNFNTGCPGYGRQLWYDNSWDGVYPRVCRLWRTRYQTLYQQPQNNLFNRPPFESPSCG